MNAEFQRYRFARIEGHNITRARLEAQFRNGINELDELENAIAKQLTAEPTNCAPWHGLLRVGTVARLATERTSSFSFRMKYARTVPNAKARTR